ncbi:MAG: translation initiation factor IF-6 [Nitrososphaerota archaeon]|nr:translation initiation factor IF-6 [Nitrososphaerota archaeon]
MGISIYDIYNNPNVGVFARANERVLLVPLGYPETKSTKLASLMGAEPVFASVGYTRLIGPLTVMNSNAILLSKFATDAEVRAIGEAAKTRVERFQSTYSSVGNLIAANDRGAVASDLFDDHEVKQIEDVLGVKAERMSISGMSQVGSLVAASNSGAVVHPKATEEETKSISRILQVDCEPCTVNGGVPYPSSGMLVNTKGAIVGTQASGPELFIIGKAFKL